MPKGSEALTHARREEIIDACAALYETMSLREITIKLIGARTSFTRTSIYNYFETREEIFLALLQREYEAWTADLDALPAQPDAAALADALARTLERRGTMLRLLSMNLYDIEANSRVENLAAFKTVYAASMQAVRRLLARSGPALSGPAAERFLYAFYPFLFGIYPYTTVTPKQQQAMAMAGVEYPRLSVCEITRNFVEKLLG
ncbi:TetR family transcriptional regulator [uncultured Subdoligranulum sp.]|uniref:TetR family transcriptional regulator n=1 Tax=uncultured Subdoligranulum sp. TaxID=512298 RepID=UPI0025F50519|nr:TetR family transcriptional regulator [uncultured Subdoligranulum sp.]